MPFPCILQALILEFWMSEMRDSSSSASRCQLLQEGRGRKAVVGTWLPMLAKHRERSRMLPLCSRQTLLAGLPSDSSCTRTPPGPKSFLVWFYFIFFVPHWGLQCESYTQASICLLQTSTILTFLPGRIIHFSQSEQVCFQRKNISMATDPSHAVELLMQLS